MSEEQSSIPQNPMQPAIKGYRKFTQEESDFINSVKNIGHHVEAKLDQALALGADPRMVSLARTKLQEGAMWLIRSVARPEGLF